MNKQILLLIAGLTLLTLNLNAQKIQKSHTKTATSLQSRLIGYAYNEVVNSSNINDTFLAPQDSLSFFYSHQRGNNDNAKQFIWVINESMGSIFDMNCDSVLSYHTNNSSLPFSNLNFKDIFTYDATNNYQSHTELAWDTTLHQYIPYSKVNYQFDLNGNETNELDSFWSTYHQQWMRGAQQIYYYNATNRHDSTLIQSWDSTALQWKNNQFIKYFYSVHLDSVIQFNWTNNNWTNQQKEVYKYDNFSNDTLYQRFSWSSNHWYVNYYYNRKFNSSNYLISYIYSSSNGSSSKYTYYPDAQNNDTLTESQMWSASTNSWLPVLQYIRSSFDANNNLLSSLYYFRSSLNQPYSLRIKANNQYNSFNQPICKECFRYYSFLPLQPHLGSFKARYYYDTFTAPTGNNLVLKECCEMNVYPSPSSTNLNVRIQFETPTNATIAIFNSQGRLMKQWCIDEQSTYFTNINITEFPSGNYFIMVHDKNGNKSGKQFSVMR